MFTLIIIKDKLCCTKLDTNTPILLLGIGMSLPQNTIYHKLSGLKQQKFILSQLARSPIKFSADPKTCRRHYGRIHCLPLLASGDCWHVSVFTGLWPHHSNLCHSHHFTFSSACLSILSDFSLPFSSKDTYTWI